MESGSLFPHRGSFVIFCSYICLFVSSGLLIQVVQKSQIKGFNSIVVVLLTELLKLLICVGVYLVRPGGSLTNLFHDLKKNSRLVLLYLVPAFLYSLYNNLTFINLELFDLTTYHCLMQFRTVVTAVIYQVLFRRKLSFIQWLSLLILTFGCLVKEYSLYENLSREHLHPSNLSLSSSNNTKHLRIQHSNENLDDTRQSSIESLLTFARLTFLLLLQMFCSCFAGVFTEFLLKDASTAIHADVFLQNMFMYFDSIFCNIFVYKLSLNSKGNKNQDQEIGMSTIVYALLTNGLTVFLIVNNALSGLMASFFLKSLNSILKTFASSLELFAVAYLAWLLFDDKVDLYTIAALILVSLALFLYSRSPVSVAPPGRVCKNMEGYELVSPTEG